MSSKRTSLIVAIVLALGGGVFAVNYISSARSNATPAPVKIVDILVAAKEIPARVQITADMLLLTQRAASEVEPDAIADPRRAVGLLSLITIPAGGTIASSKVGRPQVLGLSLMLKPGMRAVSIGIDLVKDVSGLLQPGDRVDVLAIPPRVGNETVRATTILRGVRVLALGVELDRIGASPLPGAQATTTTVTLAVTPAEAERLSAADLNATLRLSLRSPQEPSDSLPARDIVYPQANIPRAQDAPPPAAAVAAPAPAVVQPQRTAPSAPRHPGVSVIDGDKVTP